MTDSEDDPNRSVLRECYRVVCGQFQSSDDTEDKIKFSLIAISIATGLLAFAAAITSLLASTGNWPVAAGLFVAGTAVLVFAWYIGLNRLDAIILSS